MRRIAKIFSLFLSFFFLIGVPAHSWELTVDKDDFTGEKKLTAAHLEGNFVFFFNCTTGKGSHPELRVATTMDWTKDLKDELDMQFKGPNTPVITITAQLTANQSNKVLLVSNESDVDDVIGLMKAFAETKNHVSFRVSETADSTKVSGRGFSKVYKQLNDECKFTDGLAM